MHIKRLSLHEGLKRIEGTAVIIDVFRAFTCEPLMYHYGAEKIILEEDIESCRKMRGKAVLVGERDGLPIESFDLTNSPSMIIREGGKLFGNRIVVHRTTAGVTGAVAAMEFAENVLLSAFVNAKATAEYILRRGIERVSIVAMGSRSTEKAPEDEFCADYIESLLAGKEYDHVEAMGAILGHETARMFLESDRWYWPREDPVICLQRDLFRFALKAEHEEGRIVARRVDCD